MPLPSRPPTTRSKSTPARAPRNPNPPIISPDDVWTGPLDRASRPDLPSRPQSSFTAPTMAAPGSLNYVEYLTSVASGVASYVKIPLLASSGIAAVLSGLLYFKQKDMIYPSNLPANARTSVPTPSHFSIPSSQWESLTLPTPDGVSLHAYFIHPSSPLHSIPITILMFHGNAGNIGHRIPIARMLVEQLGCCVMMLEYRGYGRSTGVADERGIVVDAQVGLDYLRSQRRKDTDDGTGENDIIVYGQSLGGAVGIKLVAENQFTAKVKGKHEGSETQTDGTNKSQIIALILENTFLSIRSLIPHLLPAAKYLVPLCTQYWPSESVIPSITEVPVLFLSGLRDEMVPPAHMRRLYELCGSATKVWKALPAGDHNSSVLEEGYFDAVGEFVANCARGAGDGGEKGRGRGTKGR